MFNSISAHPMTSNKSRSISKESLSYGDIIYDLAFKAGSEHSKYTSACTLAFSSLRLLILIRRSHVSGIIGVKDPYIGLSDSSEVWNRYQRSMYACCSTGSQASILESEHSLPVGSSPSIGRMFVKSLQTLAAW